MDIPVPTYIYRMIHIDNLARILAEGYINAPNSSTDAAYIPIGETSLILQRGDKQINIEPFGTFKDYVSFYFGPRSPMLFCIQNGYDVPRLSPEKIIYLVSSIENLVESDCKFVFTDGHAYAAFTEYFNDLSDLSKIDWPTVLSKRWNSTSSDPDRKRRKSAECLVKKQVPIEALIAIGVYNSVSSAYIVSNSQQNLSSLPINIKPEWYY